MVGNSQMYYTISIIGSDKVKNVSLNDFGKNRITFGRSSDNDIVLSSPIVSNHHGYFIIDENGVSVYNNKSKNGLFVNDVMILNGTPANDGDIIKIDNPHQPLSQGVILVLSVGKGKNKWTEFDMSGKEVITIGRSKDCDIVLDRVSISLKHAKITKNKDGYYIGYSDYCGGIILNNSTLMETTKLRDKDVILINNIKLIYNKSKIIYQLYDYGVRIDAVDIVKTVRLKFKKKDISQHVNFTANPGEFIAFVGGSGAGKSTFMKCIAGVTKPTSGKVLINGNDLYNNYDVLKNLIGYVPQDNIIFNDLTLIDMLRYATNLRMPEDATRKEKEKRIDEVLDIVEMLDKKDVMIRNLSGGQQKRACIAVELLADPKLFFLDEPTSGLDPGTERSLMHTLRKMANSGKTIILVTHNTLNLHLCDKVVFFGYGGKLCFDGKPADALKFFGVDDFVDVYTLISSEPDKWRDAFAESGYRKEMEIATNEQSSSKRSESKSFFKQFFTLFRRKLKTLFNNKQQLLLMFGQAPLIAILFSFVVTNDLFYMYEETKSILFGMTTAAIWIGILNSIQEVCREKVILHKEFMADMRLSAYISSKTLYLIILAIIQSLLFVGAFMLVVDVPEMGVRYSWFFEMVFVLFLTNFSASTLGLFVSCIANDTSTALTIPALLLVPQLLFSGILFPLEGVVDKVSNFILGRWSVEALGTVNDLNSLVSTIQEAIPGFVREAESYYTFTVSHLSFDLSIIAIMAVIFVMLSYFVLKIKLESGR